MRHARVQGGGPEDGAQIAFEGAVPPDVLHCQGPVLKRTDGSAVRKIYTYSLAWQPSPRRWAYRYEGEHLEEVTIDGHP